MKALDIKLLREARRSWPQNLAIAAIVAAGVATLVTFAGAHGALRETRDAYYAQQRFADLWVDIERAPRSIVERAARLPDVLAAEGRIRSGALLDIEGRDAAATAVLLSLPERGEARLNRPYLREGRWPERRRADEVVASAAFAAANGLGPGDRLRATFGGKRHRLIIVGIALSPEFAYALGPGDIVPDDGGFGVLWLGEPALAAALDLEGAVNEIALDLAPGAREAEREAEAAAALDQLADPYGGRGSYGRADQPSDAFIASEIDQMAAMAAIIPPIFLAVMAFLVNMTLARQITLERAEIGLLKAIGYGRWAVLSHYAKGVLLVVTLGVGVGLVAGDWLADALARLYARYIDFPVFQPARSLLAFAIAALVAFVFALIGAGRAAWGAATLPPAEAMRPPSPPRYRRGMLTDLLARVLPTTALMIARNMARFPVRAGSTTLGLAFSVAVLIGGLFGFDAITEALDVSFTRIDRQQATAIFAEPQPMSALREVARWPGVLVAEPSRTVPVILANGVREHRGAITAKPRDAVLSRLVDADLAAVDAPDHGIALAAKLAEKLRLAPGDLIEVRMREGERHRLVVPVTAIVEQYVGVGAYMDAAALARLLGQAPVVSGVHVLLDEARTDDFDTAAQASPKVAAVSMIARSRTTIRDAIGDSLRVSIGFSAGFAGLIAFGVAYNSARVGLSERARELASLRVLGFTRAEAATVVVGELFACALLALPIGWGLGYALAVLIATRTAQEAFSIPVVVSPGTVALAVLVMFLAVAVSGALMARRTARLDLIAVLKTRD